MPIERLPNNLADWTVLDSTSSILSMAKDLFWETKTGSSDPNNAILVRSGVGYIERSIDGGTTWDDVTPTSNPPNDAGDAIAPAVGNCIFNQLDASRLQDEFVCMVTWQNASSEWRTWLYHTDDSFATNGTWRSITGGLESNNLSSWNTPSTKVAGSLSYPTVTIPYSSNLPQFKAMVKMTETRFVAFYEIYTYPPPEPDTNGDGYARVIEIQPDGSLYAGQAYKHTYGANSVGNVKVEFWSEDYFILITAEGDYEHWGDTGCTSEAGATLLAKSGSINEYVITFGQSVPIMQLNHWNVPLIPPGDPCSYPYEVGEIAFTKLPGTNYGIIIASDKGGFLGNDNASAWVLEKSPSGNTIWVGDRYDWELDTDHGGIGVGNFDIVAHDHETATIFYYSSLWSNALIAMHVTFDQVFETLEFETRQWLAATPVYNIKAGALSSTRLIVMTRMSGIKSKTYLVERTGTSYAIIDTEDYEVVEPLHGGIDIDLEIISPTKWAVCWSDGNYFEGDDTYIRARIGYMATADTQAYGTMISFTELNEQSDRREVYGISIAVTAEVLMCYFGDWGWVTDAYNNVRAITADLSVTHEVKGLGINISKGTGTIAWMTVWSSDNLLALVGIDLTTFTLAYYINLGEATEAEVNAKTWIIYPYALPIYDTNVLVFGRMDSGSGVPIHVYMVNLLLGNYIVEDGWGANHCSSLVGFSSGGIWAIKNNGSSSELYAGPATVGLELQNTLPFSSGVAPRSLYVDPRDGTVLACAESAGSIMVSVCTHPYTSWYDITGNHGVAAGVSGLAVL